LERAFPFPAWTSRGLPRIARIAWTLTLLCIGLAIFRSRSLTSAWLMLGRMFHPFAGVVLPAETLLVALAVIGCIVAGHLIGSASLSRRLERFVPAPVLGAGLAILFLVIQLLIPEAGKPFVYFQF
jgi:alginate O-acetyltransferase complex protein AlgI